jgi:putative membrane protein
MMDYIFQPGFLGTRAPFFMDFVSVIVAVLPFLIFGAIMLAKKKHYRAHENVQSLLFVVSVIVVGFFEYGVRMEGGYKNLMEGTSVSHDYLLYVLIFHILISVTTLILWIKTLYFAKRYKKQTALPGLYSKAHKKDGQRTFVGIILTMLTGAWVYMLLFVF